ncbi:hypothetical protein Agabi119p4_3636 [Agaricus bisporus var. burnettii]|uniref:SRR1-like domain-containing protein n=1 Tax=Agaricus bisporus var. burnettii TaxID=192524 RepID=A0A8H7KI64_AGABI|nr:hypothetical protein Agabi119p4_3636 [Agaricus bisporus var. burnettii]
MNESLNDKNTSPFSYSEFTPVIPRRNRKNKPQQVRPPLSVLVQRTRDEMSNDVWFSQCQSIIRESLKPFPNEPSSFSVLCLGLGSPSASAISRTQLAFLMELCLALNIGYANVSLYDPIFSTEDLELFEELRFQILPENRNGGYPLQNPTICYMPHCDMELYDNLLRVNDPHDHLLMPILLANHLMDYLENNSHDKLRVRVPDLFKIAPLLQSRSLPPSTAWPAAFNNTSVQCLLPADTLSGD